MSAVAKEVVTRSAQRLTTITGKCEVARMPRKFDGRKFSAMSAESRWVVRAAWKLFDWQDEQNAKDRGALGYPKAAAFADGYKGSRSYRPITPEFGETETPPEHMDIFIAIQSLGDIHRLVFIRTHRDGMEPRAVANLINSTPRGVESKLSVAYAALAVALRSRGMVCNA